MFEKNEKIKKVDISIDNLNKDNELLYSNSFIEMVDKHHYNQNLEEQEEYQNNITNYINRKLINQAKKEYNPIIVNLYNNGELIINNEKYYAKEFFIVYDNNLNNFHIKCINEKYKNEEITYNRLVKFIDSTAFTKLIKSNDANIIDNKIIIKSVDILNKYVNDWDGYLHNETVETDSILNRKMIEDGKDE